MVSTKCYYDRANEVIIGNRDKGKPCICKTCGGDLTKVNHYFYTKDGMPWMAENAIGLSCDPAIGRTHWLEGRRKAVVIGIDVPEEEPKAKSPACNCPPHLLMVHSEQKNCEWMKAKLAGKEVK